MKRTGILLFFLLFTSLLRAQTYAVTIKIKDASLEEVFEALEKVSAFTFLFSDEQIKNTGKFTFHYIDTDIRTILDECLKGKGLSYRLVDRTFVLIPSPSGLSEKSSRLSLPMLVKGKIRDKKGHPLIGVNIYVKNNPGLGIMSDENGEFQIRVHCSDILIFSHIGYKSKEIFVLHWKPEQKIYLEEENHEMEEVRIIGFGQQRKISVIGALSDMKMEGKNFPLTSFSNMISGNVSGVIGVQRNGEPGQDFSEFWIRGISTFGANDKALVLIDGIERTTLDNLIAEDIAGFSVLKDATATAVYGARGANGVILITTRRGKKGQMSIHVNSRTMLTDLPRLPHYLRAYDYARLANEARAVRGEPPLYTPVVYDILHWKLDPDLYPDVDWQKELLKKRTWGQQINVSISGGGDICRYYIGLHYKTNDAQYKESGLHRYHTNVLRKQYSFRTNLDINLTPSTEVGVSAASTLVNMNRPGIGNTDSVWHLQAALNPLSVPIRYSTGHWPVYGETNQASPIALMNESGYLTEYRNDTETKLEARQDLSYLLSGLSASLSFAYDMSNLHKSERTKMPSLYWASGRNSKGELQLHEKVPERKISYHSTAFSDRKLYLEIKTEYNRNIRDHRIGGLLLYHRSRYVDSKATDEIGSIPRKSMGIAGRLTYSYQDIYLSEFNFGYNGSENFPKGRNFGFFPSIAVGWVISGYERFRKRFPFMHHLKLRYSFGITGNDQIADSRFPYLSYISSDVPGYAFGNLGENVQNGIAETIVGTNRLSWEKAVKHNLGIDLDIAGKFRLELDYFREQRQGIFMRRNDLPGIMGLPSPPFGNIGRMLKYGFDGTLVYKSKIATVDVELRGNFTWVKNKILDYDESGIRYDYQKMQGKSYNQARGYIALGYFRDSLDILSSPLHPDAVRPGDLKYKDINGDGKITPEDIVPIGHSVLPGLQYGFAGSFAWKNWDFSIFFRGAGRVHFFYGGTGYFPFSEGADGNVLTIAGKQKNRWTPAWYSGNPATENPKARFPRLSYGENKNNFLPSTHWLENGAYLRLKTLEVGYNFPARWLRKVYIKKLRLSFTGDNLYLWDRVKLWDPEQASGNGAVYPLPRSFLLNLQLTF